MNKSSNIFLIVLLMASLLIIGKANPRLTQQTDNSGEIIVIPPSDPTEPSITPVDNNDTAPIDDSNSTDNTTDYIDITNDTNNDYWWNDIDTNTDTTISDTSISDGTLPPTPTPIYQGDLTNITIPSWLNSDDKELVIYLTDQYNYFVTKKGNRVWAGALNLCWNEFRRALLQNQFAKFINVKTPIQQKLIDNLNAQLFSKQDLSQNSYYVTSGFGQQTVNRINRQVRQKFPDKTFQDLNLNLEETSFISYAYIYKRLQFVPAFEDDYNFYFKNEKVPAFMAKTNKQRSKLYYKYYNSQDDFLLGIESNDPTEQILLIKSPNDDVSSFRFQKIIKLLALYEDLPNHKLERIDKFSMPNLNLDYSRTITQLEGLQFTNDNVPGSSAIHTVVQNIKLKVNKQGVIMQNQAYMIVTMVWGQHPKYFYLDNDFWIVLKQKGKAPYCIMLIKSVDEKWSS